MESKMKWLKWPLEHYSISLLIVAILFVAGIYGMYVMPKDEFPHVVIRQILSGLFNLVHSFTFPQPMFSKPCRVCLVKF